MAVVASTSQLEEDIHAFISKVLRPLVEHTSPLMDGLESKMQRRQLQDFECDEDDEENEKEKRKRIGQEEAEGGQGTQVGKGSGGEEQESHHSSKEERKNSYAGKDNNHFDPSDDTIFVAEMLCAVYDNDILRINALISELKEREAFQFIPLSENPFNVLHYAALASSSLAMETVLKQESDLQIAFRLDVNATSGDHCFATPLHIAARRGDLSMAKLLIVSGANVRAIRDQYVTVFHDAVHRLCQLGTPECPVQLRSSQRKGSLGEGSGFLSMTGGTATAGTNAGPTAEKTGMLGGIPQVQSMRFVPGAQQQQQQPITRRRGGEIGQQGLGMDIPALKASGGGGGARGQGKTAARGNLHNTGASFRGGFPFRSAAGSSILQKPSGQQPQKNSMLLPPILNKKPSSERLNEGQDVMYAGDGSAARRKSKDGTMLLNSTLNKTFSSASLNNTSTSEQASEIARRKIERKTIFDLCVLLVNQGADPLIHAVPGCPLDPDISFQQIEEIQAEAEEKMKRKETAVIENEYKTSSLQSKRLFDYSAPSYDRHLASFIQRRLNAAERRRLQERAMFFTEDPYVKSYGMAAVGSASNSESGSVSRQSEGEVNGGGEIKVRDFVRICETSTAFMKTLAYQKRLKEKVLPSWVPPSRPRRDSRQKSRFSIQSVAQAVTSFTRLSITSKMNPNATQHRESTKDMSSGKRPFASVTPQPTTTTAATSQLSASQKGSKGKKGEASKNSQSKGKHQQFRNNLTPLPRLTSESSDSDGDSSGRKARHRDGDARKKHHKSKKWNTALPSLFNGAADPCTYSFGKTQRILISGAAQANAPIVPSVLGQVMFIGNVNANFPPPPREQQAFLMAEAKKMRNAAAAGAHHHGGDWAAEGPPGEDDDPGASIALPFTSFTGSPPRNGEQDSVHKEGSPLERRSSNAQESSSSGVSGSKNSNNNKEKETAADASPFLGGVGKQDSGSIHKKETLQLVVGLRVLSDYGDSDGVFAYTGVRHFKTKFPNCAIFLPARDVRKVTSETDIQVTRHALRRDEELLTKMVEKRNSELDRKYREAHGLSDVNEKGEHEERNPMKETRRCIARGLKEELTIQRHPFTKEHLKK